jgi:hypothetical protein
VYGGTGRRQKLKTTQTEIDEDLTVLVSQS